MQLHTPVGLLRVRSSHTTQIHEKTAKTVLRESERGKHTKLTCEMYPGGTWMGGIDPFGDIMGTSAGPENERRGQSLVCLFTQPGESLFM